MFSKELRLAGHVKRFLISRLGEGWEVLEEQDRQVVRKIHYTDWHRVERAQSLFDIEIGELESEGWVAAV